MAQSTAPIPIVLLGKIPGHQQAVTDIVKPEYRVIQLFDDLSTAIPAIAALMSSQSISSDDPTVYPVPRLIVMGGGFSHADFETVRNTVPEARDVPWLRPEITKPGGGGVRASSGPPPSGPPPSNVVAKRVREKLDEKLDVVRAGGGKGEVWWF